MLLELLEKKKSGRFDIFKNGELQYPGCDRHTLTNLLESDIFSDDERLAVRVQLAATGKAIIEVPLTSAFQVDPDSPECDAARGEILKRWQAAIRLRVKLGNEAMDVCSIPDCVQPGIVTVKDRQWCESHATAVQRLP